MGKVDYLKLDDLIEMIDEPNRGRCLRLMGDNRELMMKSWGSKNKHQAWEGGYLEHVVETMNLARLYYDSLSSTGRRLPFSLSDSLLVLFLHDIEKPWKQFHNDQFRLQDARGVKDENVIMNFRKRIAGEYNFELTEEHWNAIKYVEGEGDDYHPFNRVANELAAFCHLCDYTSGRIWHDYPLKDRDGWKT